MDSEKGYVVRKIGGNNSSSQLHYAHSISEISLKYLALNLLRKLLFDKFSEKENQWKLYSKLQ